VTKLIVPLIKYNTKLYTGEAENGKIMIQDQPGKKVHKTPFQSMAGCCACLSFQHKQENHSPGQPGKNVRPYFKTGLVSKTSRAK
jgi:hypothetical protein